MKEFQTSVIWDLTLTSIECLPSQSFVPVDQQGLVKHAVKFQGTTPDAVAGKYLPGASVHNSATGVWYRNTGTTASPTFSVWAI